MWVLVGDIQPETLSLKIKTTTGETEKARERIQRARNMQSARFKNNTRVRVNADMGPAEIEHLSQLSSDAEKILVDAARTLKLSARGYHRTIKLARTIADLASAETIESPHMLEALQYRVREM